MMDRAGWARLSAAVILRSLCVLSLAVASAHAAAIRASNDPVKDERPITAKDREHWAWRPLMKVDAANLDAVVAQKTPIEKEADAATLIRRVTFDLTGLPPSASDLSDLSEWSDQKYEALVGRLLDSPRYGEHWAQWWLDLARFAESDGFEYDAVRERAWQYRDWVIAALNADTPLDVFVQQQLAGDLTGAETATGFLMAGPDMPDVNNQVERRHIFLNDMTATVGTVCLGLTLGCAQCHDHPYDPISQADFYRLRAFFDATVMPKERKPLGPVARVVTDGVPASVVFVRGESKRPGPAVQPAFPRIGFTKPAEASKPDRLALAKWITSKENVLFARSMANRLWQQHFGKPLAGNPGDLGHQGEAPTHPELLDYLTTKFVKGGWHLKPLHREIMLSAAYRQTARQEPDEVASKVDPSNRYLWRFNPRRLDAEQVRDALLAVSGELDAAAGGPAGDGNSTRRSVYTMKKRNNPNELLRALDMPAGFASTAERQSTTTPTQALQLLNGDWLLARARKLASRVEGIDDAWMAVLGRPPTPKEKATAEGFLKKRAGTTKAKSSEVAESGDGSETFKENSAHERLLINTSEKEGDEFTVEAVASLNSVDVNASVRTLASRWNGGKDSLEAFGWSLGVTGEKSRYKPRNVIVQVVGEDENSNIGYQVVPSNIHIELGRRYHIAARVSCPAKNVTFTVRDLDTPGAAVQSAVVPMDIRSKLSLGSSQLVIGGLNKRAPSHQWDGRIEAVRILTGYVADKALSADPEKWSAGFVVWRAADPLNSQFAWNGSDVKSVEEADPFRQAMNDLCQVLLNTNEFFYLH